VRNKLNIRYGEKNLGRGWGTKKRIWGFFSPGGGGLSYKFKRGVSYYSAVLAMERVWIGGVGGKKKGGCGGLGKKSGIAELPNRGVYQRISLNGGW